MFMRLAEHILIERSTHTPPSLWMLGLPSVERWPQADRNRACHSAPPAAHFSPDSSRRNRNSRRARNKQMMQQLQHQQDEQAQAMEVDDEEEEKTVASRTGNQMATSGGPIGNGTITGTRSIYSRDLYGDIRLQPERTTSSVRICLRLRRR